MDCPDPGCREDLLMQISAKVSKHAVWIAMIAVGLPLLGINVGVWSEVSHSADKYATKTEINQHSRDLTACKEWIKRLPQDIRDIKTDIKDLREDMQEQQKDTAKDIKEILRHLRDKK